MMNLVFDPRKEAANREKHGISLELGLRVLAGRSSEFLDTRRDYGEDRLVCFGYVEDRLHVCVYTTRGDEVRIISVRKANDREVKHYG